jgi:hypothetical protein
MERFLNKIFVSDFSGLNSEQGDGDKSCIFVKRVSKEEWIGTRCFVRTLSIFLFKI